MAYVFNQIMGLLDPQQDKVNLFAPEQGGQAPSGGGAAPNSDIKTSVEGAINTPSASSGAGAQQALQRSSLVAPSAGVLKANLGKVQAPKATGEAMGQIAKAGQDLQAEANQYAQGYQKTTAPSAKDIEKGIAGDKSGQKAITDILNKSINQASETFKPKTDTNIELASQFSTPAGVQGALQREGGDEYTKGMGAFDLSLLGQTPQFAQTMEALGRGQKTLTEQSDKAVKESTAKRFADEQASLAGAQGSLRDTLSGKAQGIKDIGKKGETAFDNQIAYYNGQYKPTPQEKAAWDKELSDYTGSMIPQAQGQLNAYRGFDFGDYLTPENIGKVDASKYVNYTSPDATDYTQFVSPDQANQFNNIMSMLGQSDSLTRGQAPTSKFGFNQQGYTAAALDQARAAKAQEDAAAAFRGAGGLESGFEGMVAPAQGAAPVITPGALALPSYDPNVTLPPGFVNPVMQGESGYPVGTLMLPDGVTYSPSAPVTKKKSDPRRNRNEERGR